MNINRIVLLVVSAILFSCSNHTETANKTHKTKANTCRVAFYNVENLFDTEDDKHTNDNDFLPSGKLKWTDERYQQKIQHIQEVLEGLNENQTLALFGMAEVENRTVLEDLLKKDSAYQIIHYNSSDKRGIDVCLLYSTSYFTPLTSYLSSSSVNENDDDKVFLREVLVVKGILWSDTVHVLVNHWPSRREGEEESEHKRMAAAKATLRLIDSISLNNLSRNIIVMGDFNDQPNDKSISTITKMLTSGSTEKNDVVEMMNPFEEKQNVGEGTCKYKRDWFLFDQMLLSNSIMDKKGCQFLSAEIYDPEWLYYKQDVNSGPYRTYMGDKYYGGYSDHFPVYIELKK